MVSHVIAHSSARLGRIQFSELMQDNTNLSNLGYVQQQDLHLPTSTVREALQFSALLRQPPDISRTDKLDYVEEVIRLLDMQDYAGAVVGVPGEGEGNQRMSTIRVNNGS